MRKFPKNAVEEKRMLSADKEVESCCNLPYNGADAFVCVIPIVNLLPPPFRLQKRETFFPNNILPFAITLKSRPL